MDEQFTIRLLVAAGSAVIGVLFLAYAGWARAGRTPRARAWMREHIGAEDRQERNIVLGLPSVGLICLCISASLLPRVGMYLLFGTVPAMLVLFLLVMWARWTIIPMPGAFFPRWARPIRERNRQAEAATKKLIRRT